MSDLLDHSIANPGPMGWGEEHLSADAKHSTEQRQFAALAEAAPLHVMRHEAKEPSQRVLKLIQDEMAKDGITGGFSARYIEPVVFGAFLTWLAQLIGSCVASGGMRAATRRMLIEIFLLGQAEETFGRALTGIDNVAPFGPYSYRAGRRLGNMNGNSDGSYCSVHTRGAMTYGWLPCSTPGLQSDAFPEPQSTSLYRQWGASNGLMDQFASAAKKFLLLESENIRSASDAKIAATEHYKPMMICSSWAFRPDYVHPTWKDRDGKPIVIYKRDTSTSWSHNMTVDGVVVAVEKDWVIIDNSWGMNAHKNGSFFVIPFALFADWVRAAEIQTIGDIDLSDSAEPLKEPA